MPIQISLDFNVDNLRRALDQYPQQSVIALRDASMKAAFAVEGQAKIFSPVDTGRLRASIATSLGIASRGIQSIVSTNVEYAVYVHEGTRRMRARPFMKQAAEAKQGEIEAYFSSAIRNILR